MGYDPLKNVGYGIWGQKWDVGYHYQKFPKMVSNLSYFPINHTLVSNIAYLSLWCFKKSGTGTKVINEPTMIT